MLGATESFLAGFEAYWPVIWPLIAAAVCVSIELSFRDRKAAAIYVFYAGLGGVLLAFVSLFSYWPLEMPTPMLQGGVIVDRFGLYLSGGILAGTAICCFSSLSVIERLRVSMADYMALVLVAATGMLLLVVSNDLIMIFLSIELMSLAIYVLVGINRASGEAAEASMKYFVMGAFASGFLLFGMALIYGLTGEIALDAMSAKLAALPNGYMHLALLAFGLLLIGFAFKVGAVPFHQWVPDVYTGAPTPITGFMAVTVKIAAFGALGRIVMELFPRAPGDLLHTGDQALWLIAMLTMVVGNWLAVTQENVKRMLAYSSIAHSGYLLMGLVAARGNADGMAAILFYLIVYAFGTGGAFAILTWLSGEREHDDYADLRGLAKRHPAAALAMTIFMFSLAGIPLTGGFLGKYYLFSTAIGAGYIWLAVLGILASIIGAYYYLRVVVLVYMKDPAHETGEASDHWGVKFAVAGTAVATILLGILPATVMGGAGDAVAQLGGGAYDTRAPQPELLHRTAAPDAGAPVAVAGSR